MLSTSHFSCFIRIIYCHVALRTLYRLCTNSSCSAATISQWKCASEWDILCDGFVRALIRSTRIDKIWPDCVVYRKRVVWIKIPDPCSLRISLSIRVRHRRWLPKYTSTAYIVSSAALLLSSCRAVYIDCSLFIFMGPTHWNAKQPQGTTQKWQTHIRNWANYYLYARK